MDKVIVVRIFLVLAFLVFPTQGTFAQFGSDLGVQNRGSPLIQNEKELQESLIWTGHYNGLVDGVIGDRTIIAIRNFQTSLGVNPTGTLTNQEYSALIEKAARVRSKYGWTNFKHPVAGYRISYPAGLLTKAASLPNGGRKFSSPDPRLRLDVEIVETNSDRAFETIYEQLSADTYQRNVSYKRIKDNWFVVIGSFADTKFYTRVEDHSRYLIGYTFRWADERSTEFETMAVAIASSFEVPEQFRIPERQELEHTEIIQSNEHLTQPSNSVKLDGDLRIAGTPRVEQPSALTPREIFTEVKESVWMVVAAPIKNRKVDLGNAKQGSAVAVSDRFLLTNCHTLEDTDVIVILRGQPEERLINVSVVVSDVETDRCVLGTENVDLENYAAIRPSSEVAVGERVYSIGAPSGLDLTISEGLLSGRRIMDNILYFQNSAPISPGSSGGGLFDNRGNLIGITTSGLQNAQNLNFAIAAEEFSGLENQ